MGGGERTAFMSHLSGTRYFQSFQIFQSFQKGYRRWWIVSKTNQRRPNWQEHCIFVCVSNHPANHLFIIIPAKKLLATIDCLREHSKHWLCICIYLTSSYYLSLFLAEPYESRHFLSLWLFTKQCLQAPLWWTFTFHFLLKILLVKLHFLYSGILTARNLATLPPINSS